MGSARALSRLCEAHDAYRWLCGGVRVNHHILSDFRVGQGAFLDALLTQSVASLMSTGAVTLKRVAQDGMRVRASAGAASFRRKGRLQELQAQARGTDRARAGADAGDGGDQEANGKPIDSARVSTTDPQATVMKMADGGFRPAFNVQFATDTSSQVVVGVDVTERGSDYGEMPVMLDQLARRYDTVPEEMLVDGGFTKLADVEQAAEKGTTVFGPVPQPKDPERDRRQPLAEDSEVVAVAYTHGHRRGQDDLQGTRRDRRVRQRDRT